MKPHHEGDPTQRVTLILGVIITSRRQEDRTLSREEAETLNAGGWYVLKGCSLTRAAFARAWSAAQEALE